MSEPRAGKQTDLGASLRERLEAAGREDDAERLRTLDELYERLENELEGDLDQEGPTGH